MGDADDPEEDNLAWLTGLGFVLPTRWKGNRNPTPRELRQIVEFLPDTVTHNIYVDDGNKLGWCIEDTSDGTILHVQDYCRDGAEDVPHFVYFYRGSPELVVKIMERIAQFCGPFFVGESGGEIIIVEAGTPADTRWVDGWPRKRKPDEATD